MAENETDGVAGAGAAGAATAAVQPQVKLLAHFVRDLSFENVGALEGTPAEGQPDINVSVNLEANSIGENRYQSVMKINATAKSPTNTRFVVELDYCGVFSLENIQQEHVHPFVFIECPRQLLPFARRVVADATRDGGYPPLMLDNVDFATLYRQRVEQLRAQQGDGNASV
ncbi:MAG: protein-export chaperone SecB [Pseudomonadota bacterium]